MISKSTFGLLQALILFLFSKDMYSIQGTSLSHWKRVDSAGRAERWIFTSKYIGSDKTKPWHRRETMSRNLAKDQCSTNMMKTDHILKCQMTNYDSIFEELQKECPWGHVKSKEFQKIIMFRNNGSIWEQADKEITEEKSLVQ